MKESLLPSTFRPHANSVKEVESLAIYLDGLAEGSGNPKIRECQKWMDKLSHHVCSQGYIGCGGGDKCDSDHK